MIIGDHVIFCFLRALDNQVYAASVSAAKIDDTAAFYVLWADSTLVSLW